MAERLTNARLTAPDLIALELANICVTKSRRQPDLAAKLATSFRLRRHWAIDERPVDHDAVLDLAMAIGLTAYDASYLWLARHLGAELVTLDRQLAKAASQPAVDPE